VERAIVYSNEGRLALDWFEGSARTEPDGAAVMAAVPVDAPTVQPTRLADVERDHILALLRRTGGVIEGPRGVAKLLDMKPSTARHRIARLGIRKSEYLD
ncbi:MAG: histidine kinase, partial [Gammaproteobacteria bacterium]|nr:histidine kinase [Gammaproteobacteria bacterium]